MPFRLLLDEDVPILLAQVLRGRGHDVVHVTEAGLSGARDDQVFHDAIEQERAALTHNVAHFLALTERFAEEGRHHHGLARVVRCRPASCARLRRLGCLRLAP